MIVPSQVEVRARDEYSASGYTFTSWSLDDLDRLIGVVNRWAVGDVVGQFASDNDGQWFFELVFCDE